MREPVKRRWRKSSHSGGAETCVEVMELGSRIAVRDSKDPDGPVLVPGAEAWRAFVEYAR